MQFVESRCSGSQVKWSLWMTLGQIEWSQMLTSEKCSEKNCISKKSATFRIFYLSQKRHIIELFFYFLLIAKCHFFCWETIFYRHFFFFVKDLHLSSSSRFSRSILCRVSLGLESYLLVTCHVRFELLKTHALFEFEWETLYPKCSPT